MISNSLSIPAANLSLPTVKGASEQQEQGFSQETLKQRFPHSERRAKKIEAYLSRDALFKQPSRKLIQAWENEKDLTTDRSFTTVPKKAVQRFQVKIEELGDESDIYSDFSDDTQPDIERTSRSIASLSLQGPLPSLKKDSNSVESESLSSKATYRAPYGDSPSPYAMSPSPYTLSPSPYTLSPSPYTLSASPYTTSPSQFPRSLSAASIPQLSGKISPAPTGGFKLAPITNSRSLQNLERIAESEF